MFSKRMSLKSQARQSSISEKASMTSDIKQKSHQSSPVQQHYNDWPNAVGFDTVYEEHEPVQLLVKGRIPGYAAGTLFRTGLGPRTVQNDDGKLLFKSNHWFDGFSSVHRFQLHTTSGGADAHIEKVTYNSRLTSDGLIDKLKRGGKMNDITFANNYEPCKSFFQKVQSVFEKASEHEPNGINNAVTMSINYPGLTPAGTSQTIPHSLSTEKNILTLCNKTDSARMQFLDPTTLKPTGISYQANLDASLKGPLSAAHPETCPVTGDVYNYNLDFNGPKATYRVFKTSAATGKTSILASIAHVGAYLHSLFLTEHFVILCVWNTHFTKAGASILWNKNLLDSMAFNSSVPATWYVVDRRCPSSGGSGDGKNNKRNGGGGGEEEAGEGGQGVVAKFESDPFFAFHTVNAFEERNTTTTPSSHTGETTVDLVCDVSMYTDSSVLHHFYMDNLVSSDPTAIAVASKIAHDKQQSGNRYENIRSRLRRYRLSGVTLPSSSSSSSSSSRTSSTTSATNISSGTPQKASIDFTALASDSPELPTFNPLYATKPTRYTYGIITTDGTKSTFVDGLVKFDALTQTAIHWERKGHTPGEAIFIPGPATAAATAAITTTSSSSSGTKEGGKEEDDGILLTVVLDGYTSKSYLLCLDARDMSEMGRCEVGGAVGFGFHGAHVGSMA